MKVITNKGTIDTETDAIVIIFNDDNELNGFMTMIATTPVRTSGIRILSLIPDNMELSPIQAAVLEVINGIDGACSNDNVVHEKIVDESIDRLNDILNKH